MTQVWAAVSYGLGGDGIDYPASGGKGEDYLVARLKAIGVNTLSSPYQWSDGQVIINGLMAVPKGDKIAIVGDSLGDNEIGVIARALVGHRNVDFVGGFQGSVYGVHSTIPSNVARALAIYNPNWFETWGLGDYPWPLDVPPIVPAGQNLYDGRWRLGNNGKTWVRYVQIEAPHPDDWGQAQDIVFSEIKQLKGAA